MTSCGHCGQKLPNQLLASDTEVILDSITIYDRKGLKSKVEGMCLCPICSRNFQDWLLRGDRISAIR